MTLRLSLYCSRGNMQLSSWSGACRHGRGIGAILGTYHLELKEKKKLLQCGSTRIPGVNAGFQSDVGVVAENALCCTSSSVADKAC
uniref:Uncharacterized protein n=1 Tax=Physcomitrium patens TaxID=3218 RepID=A0A2K1JKT9_PHYPA|nr:hypothetical protein PHYPA_016984 [Physcomitrium patens]